MSVNWNIEFWNGSTKNTFEANFVELVEHGYSEEEAQEFLEDMYNTVGQEFGQ